MGKPRWHARFIVGAPDGPRSALWRAASKGDDVYLWNHGRGGVTKYSFHASGICQYAFTAEHGAPPTLPNRKMLVWERLPAPAADGQGKGCRVMCIGIPTDTLSIFRSKPTKPVTWIAPAPKGRTTQLDLLFTREPKDVIQARYTDHYKDLIAFTPLPSGEAFCVIKSCADWPWKDFAVSGGGGNDLIVTRDDSDNTGRPIRLSTHQAASPGFGGTLFEWEWGCYSAPPGTWERIRPKKPKVPIC